MNARTESHSTALRAAAFGAFLVVLAALASCGGASPAADDSSTAGEAVQRVTRPERTYAIDDFRGAGLKANKSYDTSELESAVEAWHGVFGGKEFEVRLYASHEDATDLGAQPAEHVTGKEGVVVGEDVWWKEGERDRRKCVPRAGLSEHGCLQTARYGDYMVVGNVVLLCEGLDSETALETCAGFLANLD